MGEVEAAAAGEQELARWRGRGVVNDDAAAGAGERFGRRQTGRSGADHDGVDQVRFHHVLLASKQALQVRGPPPRRGVFHPPLIAPLYCSKALAGMERAAVKAAL